MDGQSGKHIGQGALKRQTYRGGQHRGRGDQRCHVDVEDVLQQDQRDDDEHKRCDDVLKCCGEAPTPPPYDEEIAVHVEAEPECCEGENEPGEKIKLAGYAGIVLRNAGMKKYLDCKKQRNELESETDGP